MTLPFSTSRQLYPQFTIHQQNKNFVTYSKKRTLWHYLSVPLESSRLKVLSTNKLRALWTRPPPGLNGTRSNKLKSDSLSSNAFSGKTSVDFLDQRTTAIRVCKWHMSIAKLSTVYISSQKHYGLKNFTLEARLDISVGEGIVMWVISEGKGYFCMRR